MTLSNGGRATGMLVGAVSDYSSLTPDSTRAHSLLTDYLRTSADALGGVAHELHGETRERDLNERTLAKSKKAVSGLLDELTNQRGMGWSHIAEVIGVSVSAIRKWRKGGDATPESRLKLAKIAALLDLLQEKGLVQEPAAWIELDLPLDSGHYIRPLDLYLDGHVTALLDMAEQRKTPVQVLDQVRPNWRASRTDFEVFVDTDGERSIRRREG